MTDAGCEAQVARSAALLQLQAGRARAASIAPYLAAALFALRPHETSAVQTMAVTPAYELYWSSDFVATLDVEQCAAVFIHEVSHLLRHHSQRGAALGVTDETSRLWNIACDMAINSDLRDMGLDLPAGVFTEDLGVRDRLSAEDIFSLLTSEGSDALDKEGVADCGSGVGGGRRSWEEEAVAAGGIEIGEVIARRVARAIVAENTVVAAGRGEEDSGTKEGRASSGAVPGAWLLWAERVYENRIDWRKQLAKLTRRALVRQGLTDYTTSKLARREAEPFLLSSLAGVAPVRCVAVVDTSASIDERELASALTELAGLVRALGGQPIDVVLCDTEANVVRRVVDPWTLELRGGGGTDLRVGIRTAAELRPAADLIVVVTDGITPWPVAPPDANRRAIYLAVLLASAPDPPPFMWTVSIPGAAANEVWPDMAAVGRPFPVG
ncbi:MAG: DUF2201 family putative metallopeptidase [Acidimicrobiales bacterium]